MADVPPSAPPPPPPPPPPPDAVLSRLESLLQELDQPVQVRPARYHLVVALPEDTNT